MIRRTLHYGEIHIDLSTADAQLMDMLSHSITLTYPDGRKIDLGFTTRNALSFACVDMLVGVCSLLCDGLAAEERAEIDRLDGLRNLMYSVHNNGD